MQLGKANVQLTQRFTRLTVALAVLFAAFALAFAPAGAQRAEAHDQLLRSIPASGETVAQAPSEATLEFSGNVAEIGSEVALLHNGEAIEIAGPLQFAGGKVTVPLPGLDNGSYELNWRVVSTDGHPISGTVPFTVGTAGSDDGNGQGLNNKTKSPDDFELQQPGDQGTSQGGASGPMDNPMVMIAIGVIGVAVIGAMAVLMYKRFSNGNSPVRPDVFGDAGNRGAAGNRGVAGNSASTTESTGTVDGDRTDGNS